MQRYANFTKKEAAAYLRVGVRTLERWVNQGKVSQARIGPHTVIYPKKELDRFIEESMTIRRKNRNDKKLKTS